MTPQPPLNVVAIRTGHTDRIDYHVFTYGSTDPLTLEMVADKLRRQAGTHRPSPLEEFLEDHGLELIVHHGSTPGTCSVRIGHDVSVRDPHDRYLLHPASAEARSLQGARAKLARQVSGRTIVQSPMLPTRTTYKVPVLQQEETPPDDNPRQTA